jgi:hypothetical protein
MNAEDRASFALYQYNRAIACLLDQMRTADARPLVPLLTCVLFVCIELMQNKDRESLDHLKQGRQILSQLGRKTLMRSPELDLIKQHLVPMYTRLSLTSLMLSGDPVMIPTPLKTLTEVPVMFETIDEVRYVFYDFMEECLRFAKKSHAAKIGEIPSEDMRAFENEQDYLLRKLAKFKVAFSLFRAAKGRDGPPGSIALLQIHMHTAFIWVSTALSRHETVFDDHVDTFSAIIPLATEFMNALAAAPPISEQHTGSRPTSSVPSTTDTRRLSAMFTFEVHVIAPLYFVAAKCRHPVIRRAALHLLRRNPSRRENLWRANVMAAIAERTMRLEEKHLRPQHTESQPQSQCVSPREPSAQFPYSFGPGDAWASSLPDTPFPDSFFRADLGEAAVGGSGTPFFNTFDAGQRPPATTSYPSSSVTTGSIDAPTIDHLGGILSSHTPIDPNLFFDATEVSSTAHSFSVAPSTASSLDDIGGIAAPSASPYISGRGPPPAASAEQAPEMWGAVSATHAPPGIALEPPTPVNHSSFAMSLTLPTPHPHPHPHPQTHQRAQSRQTSLGSPSIGSEGSSPSLHAAEGVESTDMEFDLVMEMLNTYHHHPQYQQQEQRQQQQGTGGIGPGLDLGIDLGLNLTGLLSPTATVSRSADAPFDVPERFRVHESIIGPDKEDGTSWVMMFRKLGGLDAEWDVLTEYVAVT